MVGKLLSIDLKSQGIAVAMVHTGYLRKQNKDSAWDSGDKHGESRHPLFLVPFPIPLLRICSLFE
jgi:hypothetical protein